MLIGHTLKYLPAQVLSPVAQLVSVILWTHWLAPSEMGIFTLVTVTQEMAYLGCLGWFAIYALRYLPAESDVPARNRYMATENVVVLASICLSTMVAAVTVWLLLGREQLLLGTFVLAAFLATRALNTHYGERARAQSSFLPYSILQIVGPVGGLAFGWLALRWFEPTALVLLGAYSVAQALATLLALPGLGIRWRIARPDVPLLRAAVAFGGPVLMLSVLGWVAENYIRYLVQWRLGAAELGLMIVGWSLGRRCAAVASTFVTTASFPLAARLLNENRRDEALSYLGINAALMVAVLLPICAAMQMLGPNLVALTVAPEYQQITSELLGLSVLAGTIRNLHMHTTDQLMVLDRRIKMLAKIDVVEIVLCAVASLIGLSLAGLRGAVIGQAVGSLATMALSVFLARKHLGFRWPWFDTAKISVATGVMMLVLGNLPSGRDVIGLAIGAFAAAAVYAGLCAIVFAPTLRSFWLSRSQ